MVLRVEDLDAPRVVPGATDALRQDLEWLGLDWDEEHLQSDTLTRIHAALERLLEAGVAYPCVCSRGDIRRAQSAPHAEDQAPAYPGTCRGRFANLEAATKEAERRGAQAPAVRFRVPPGIVSFTDVVYGAQHFDLAKLTGDFLIARHGGAPAYQLAVVVDDHAQGVTQVVRGRDLLESTAQQLLLYAALGFEPPSFAHLPLVLDEHGKRLAKRSDAVSLQALRARGVTPERLVGWAAESVGLSLEGVAPAALTARELLAHFALERLSTDDTRLTAQALMRGAVQPPKPPIS